MAQLSAVRHVVGRAAPFSRIVEPAPALPVTKFTPSTASGKASTAPAMTLEGKTISMVEPLVIAIVADPDFVGSASLVAVIRIAFGEGATGGAVNTPLASTEPQAAPAHPWPVTALCTLHVTAAFDVLLTVTKNCAVAGVAPEFATNAYNGATVTATGPEAAAICTIALPLFEGSAWLTAASVTGFICGNAAGAK